MASNCLRFSRDERLGVGKPKENAQKPPCYYDKGGFLLLRGEKKLILSVITDKISFFSCFSVITVLFYKHLK